MRTSALPVNLLIQSPRDTLTLALESSPLVAAMLSSTPSTYCKAAGTLTASTQDKGGSSAAWQCAVCSVG